MDWFSVLALFIVGGVIVKKKLLPRLKKSGQEASPDKAGGVSVTEKTVPDFCILSFNKGDFTYTEDLAHCVEYELKGAIDEIKKEGGVLVGDPFPIVMGNSLLIILYYCKTVKTEGVVL